MIIKLLELEKMAAGWIDVLNFAGECNMGSRGWIGSDISESACTPPRAAKSTTMD